MDRWKPARETTRGRRIERAGKGPARYLLLCLSRPTIAGQPRVISPYVCHPYSYTLQLVLYHWFSTIERRCPTNSTGKVGRLNANRRILGFQSRKELCCCCSSSSVDFSWIRVEGMYLYLLVDETLYSRSRIGLDVTAKTNIKTSSTSANDWQREKKHPGACARIRGDLLRRGSRDGQKDACAYPV